VNNDDDDDETVVARRNSMLMVGVYLLRIQILVVGGYPAPTQWVCRLGGPGAVREMAQFKPHSRSFTKKTAP
jgi:hypothetical protein